MNIDEATYEGSSPKKPEAPSDDERHLDEILDTGEKQIESSEREVSLSDREEQNPSKTGNINDLKRKRDFKK